MKKPNEASDRCGRKGIESKVERFDQREQEIDSNLRLTRAEQEKEKEKRR